MEKFDMHYLAHNHLERFAESSKIKEIEVL